jgi:hypothetical protein
LGEPAWEPAVEVQSEWELRGDEEGLTNTVGGIVRTQLEVAKVFGVTWRAVAGWKKRGMPGRKGCYKIEEILAWKAKNVTGVKPKKVDPEAERVAMLVMNTDMNSEHISSTTGISEGKVRRIMKLIEKYRPELEHFKANKADYFTLEQLRYRDFITDDKLERTPARDLVAMAKTAWEQERVERGESVDNVAVIVKHIRELKAQEDADSS